MGAFFISPAALRTDGVLRVFQRKGFNEPCIIQSGVNQIYLYKKQLVDNYQLLNKPEGFLFVTGTCIYKGKIREEMLNGIWNDFNKLNLDSKNFKGSFFIHINYKEDNYFIHDQAGIQNIFFHTGLKVISSSFLAVVAAVKSENYPVDINRPALLETLTTGNLIGPETHILDIERYEPAIHKGLPGINAIRFEAENDRPAKQNIHFLKAVDLQIDSSRKYFQEIQPLFLENKLLSGLTGGLDSRLLFLLFRGFTDKYVLYTTYREEGGTDLYRARELAHKAETHLKVLPVKHPDKMSQDELKNTISDNFFFNDGIIRLNHLWIEKIKSRDYLKELYNDARLGLSGIGGEQYRNAEYLLKPELNFSEWVRYELIYKHCGDVFKNRNDFYSISRRVELKIKRLLSLPDNLEKIDYFLIKRYFNEIFNPANRTTRNNIENQLVYFLSPFTEYSLSRNAYQIIPVLGSGFNFEKEMIRALAPELAGIKTSYGFSPDEKVPYKYRAIPFMKRIMGLSLFNRLYFRLKKHNHELRLFESHPWLKQWVEELEKLELPLDLKKLLRNRNLAPLVIEAGLFISEIKKPDFSD